MSDGPLGKESVFGSDAESVVGLRGGRKKRAHKTKRGGKKMPTNSSNSLFGDMLGGEEHVKMVHGGGEKKYGHGGAHRKGHVSRRRKSARRKTGRRKTARR